MLDEATVYGHLAGCTDCRTYAHDAETLHRQLRLSPAPAIPDLAPGILAAIGEERRVGSERRHAAPRCAGSWSRSR